MKLQLLFTASLLLLLNACAQIQNGDFNPSLNSTKPITSLQPKSSAIPQTLSPAAAQQIGQAFVGGIISQTPLVNNPELQNYLNRLGLWIALQSERPQLAWRFGVINTRDLNAFSTPGGHILLSQGLLNRIHSEAELAGVLGHEIAHVIKGHHLHELQQTVEPSSDSKTNFRAMMELYRRGLDNDAEYEADRMAMVLAARAGYNPYALMNLLQTLGQLDPNDSQFSLFFNSHPSPEDRLQQLANSVGDRLEAFDGGLEQTDEFQRLILRRPPVNQNLVPTKVSDPLPPNTVIHKQRIQL